MVPEFLVVILCVLSFFLGLAIGTFCRLFDNFTLTNGAVPDKPGVWDSLKELDELPPPPPPRPKQPLNQEISHQDVTHQTVENMNVTIQYVTHQSPPSKPKPNIDNHHRKV